MASTICKQDLINFGYPEHTSREIIRQAKVKMVQKGYAFYNNRRLGRVPTNVVESIIGVQLSELESEVTNDDE